MKIISSFSGAVSRFLELQKFNHLSEQEKFDHIRSVRSTIGSLIADLEKPLNRKKKNRKLDLNNTYKIRTNLLRKPFAS